MFSVRSLPFLFSALFLMAGCVSVGSSEPCIAGMDYEGKMYVELNLRADWSDPAIGTAVVHFCDDNQLLQEEPPDEHDAHRLAGVDPKYAILVVDADGAGTKASTGTVYSIPQEEIPADTWAKIQSLSR